MSTARFAFHEGLNYFLRRGQRDQRVDLVFKGRQTIKHLIESLGIPHTEVGPILVNGGPADLATICMDGDQVEVQPAANECPVPPRFLLDNHLGRLASHLRMLGFDCLYRNDFEDLEMSQIVQREERILLTRDRRLLMRKAVAYGYCLRSLDPQEQTIEVLRRFDLASEIIPFRRCLRCNHPLEPVSKEAVLERLEPLTRKYFDEFQICPACRQIYWKGSHYEHMLELIRRVTNKQS